MLKQYAAPTTLSEAIRYFADADRSLAFVVQLRWPKGVTCPHCGAEKPSFLTTRRIWKCRACKKQFSVKVGTIFEDSPLGLDKWLPALWLLANAKNGISSYELARSLGVTQKSGWFMLHRIRLAMQTKSFRKMSGTVEADESYIGGKRGNMHKAKKARVAPSTGTAHMATVMGLLERKRGAKHSTVRLAHVPNTRKNQLDLQIQSHVEHGSKLFTDAHPTYRRLAKAPWGDDYAHAAVDHAITYVDGQVHTNGLENFWSLLKRSIKGTYISVDPFHLFRYLDEQAYRFNERSKSDLERFVGVLGDVVSKRLTYETLISADMLPART
ncbi:MAG: IS1595 family transposase [Gemmatimonadaceae bacterium]